MNVTETPEQTIARLTRQLDELTKHDVTYRAVWFAAQDLILALNRSAEPMSLGELFRRLRKLEATVNGEPYKP